MEIKIINWEKFNPRKDLKSMPWFRLSSDIGYSETLFELTVEQKWLWIFVLSTCANKNSDVITVNPRYFSFHSGVKQQNIMKHMEVFENRGLIQPTNVSDRIRTDTIEYVPNEHNEHNEHNERTNASERLIFDFEKIYFEYPRKIGKTRGIAKLQKTILNQSDYDLLLLSVQNYAEISRDKQNEYIKHFSTFVNEWRDYIEIQQTEKPREYDFAQFK